MLATCPMAYGQPWFWFWSDASILFLLIPFCLRITVLARPCWTELRDCVSFLLPAHFQYRFRDPERCSHQWRAPVCRRAGWNRKLTLSVGRPASCPESEQTCQSHLPGDPRSPETEGQLSHCWSQGLQRQKGQVRYPPALSMSHLGLGLSVGRVLGVRWWELDFLSVECTHL